MYISIVILTLKIKLLPDENQKKLLLKTITEANSCCNFISKIAWSNKIFNQFKLHHLCYYDVRSNFDLASQMVIRCISKVSNSYKVSKKIICNFRPTGGITYDDNILTYKSDKVSIWCIGGRKKMPFICHNEKYLPYIKGEADLVFKNDKFYLFQSVDIPDEIIENVEEFIGIDFGLTDIAVTSDAIKHTADFINQYREKRQKIRSSIQSKGTTGARRLLKRLKGKERTTGSIINHAISKSIVKTAKEQSKGIAIEDLTNIRFTAKKRGKKFKSRLGKWSFYQLRKMLEYKSKLSGVKIVVIDPAYTSKTCSKCFHIGNRQNKSFKCDNCGNNMDADVNASVNIATLGAVINQPEKSIMCSCSVHF